MTYMRVEALHNLLCDIFRNDPNGLRRFLRFGEGNALVHVLPDERVPFAELADRVVDQLEAHGLVLVTLSRLRSAYPRRIVEIDDVASLWRDGEAEPSRQFRTDASKEGPDYKSSVVTSAVGLVKGESMRGNSADGSIKIGDGNRSRKEATLSQRWRQSLGGFTIGILAGIAVTWAMLSGERSTKAEACRECRDVIGSESVRLCAKEFRLFYNDAGLVVNGEECAEHIGNIHARCEALLNQIDVP